MNEQMNQTDVEVLELLCDADNRKKAKWQDMTVQHAEFISRMAQEAQQIFVKSVSMNYGSIVINFKDRQSPLSLNFDLSNNTVLVSHTTSDYDGTYVYKVPFQACNEDLIETLEHTVKKGVTW